MKHSNAQPIYKLILLSIFSFGFYEYYWFYRNWKHLKIHKNLKIRPILRTVGLLVPVLNLYLVYDQFKEIRNISSPCGFKSIFQSLWLAVSYFVLTVINYAITILTWNEQDPQKLSLIFAAELIIGISALAALVIVQRELNFIWKKEQAKLPTRYTFNIWEINLLIIGGMLFLLTLIETFGINIKLFEGILENIFLFFIGVLTPYIQANDFLFNLAQQSDTFTYSLVIAVFLLIVIFPIIFINSLSFVINSYINRGIKAKKLLLNSLLTLLVFPFYLMANFFKSVKSFNPLKTLGMILLIIFLLLIWIGSYAFAGIFLNKHAGLFEEPVVSSGESMYPTFTKNKDASGMVPYRKGLVVFGKKFLKLKIERGDIIVFEDEKTREITKKQFGESSGFLKRVIAVSGDTIEIRNGLVFINSKPLKEPYIAKARSTFGGEFLSECKTIKIPDNKIFVMGDNRKGSGDSRHYGLFDLNNIDHTLSLEKQKGRRDKNWRDTSDDLSDISKVEINRDKFLEFLNQKRKEAKVQSLKYQPKLERSAFKRGEVILKFDDFSYEASKSGYTMEKAMNDVGYSNTIWNEAFLQGYYEADELIQYYFEFPDWKKFFLEKDYQEFGISEVEGEINGCPTQAIVQHFAGYVPPNYTKEEINSWENLLKSLRDIQPSWQDLKNYVEFYNENKKDIDRINEIISVRVSNIESIIEQMDKNKWLTKDQTNYINEDPNLAEEEDVIAKRLNKKLSPQ